MAANQHQVPCEARPRFTRLSCEDTALATRPIKRRLHLSDLLEQVSEANRHREVQTGAPVGEEAW